MLIRVGARLISYWCQTWDWKPIILWSVLLAGESAGIALAVRESNWSSLSIAAALTAYVVLALCWGQLPLGGRTESYRRTESIMRELGMPRRLVMRIVCRSLYRPVREQAMAHILNSTTLLRLTALSMSPGIRRDFDDILFEVTDKLALGLTEKLFPSNNGIFNEAEVHEIKRFVSATMREGAKEASIYRGL